MRNFHYPEVANLSLEEGGAEYKISNLSPAPHTCLFFLIKVKLKEQANFFNL